MCVTDTPSNANANTLHSHDRTPEIAVDNAASRHLDSLVFRISRQLTGVEVPNIHGHGEGFRVGTFGDDGCFIQFYAADQWDNHQKGRKWYISPYATNSEIVQTAFAAVLAWYEHEVRELFTFLGQSIYGPHWNALDLVHAARLTVPDARKEPDTD